ncbi:MAG: hypothetical protein DIZ80_16195 [endosymbiont of Galathealinum brachiosum]|uniref:Uncharacterized protein n=1 Tax=endosymbiont of Galathealinum brachiosum TaxID=2200906 RepID=A0A370D9P9_9GAMM|nr:MAG: hypothetical protein DIZ80_16195 [endosymbiont of Galathealinum brachiosum]
MSEQLTFHNKTVDIKLSNAAREQSRKLTSVLVIEIQIYFSCLLGKRLAFYSEQEIEGAWHLSADELADVLRNAQSLTDNVYVRFNTVMTKSCPVGDYIGPPPVTDFTIKKQGAYVPGWLNIDFKNGQWSGQFGWKASNKSYANTKQVRGNALAS